MVKGFPLNLATKLAVLFLIPSLSFSTEGSVVGNLIQDVELRSQYNFDSKEYNNALRIQIGTFKSGAKLEVLEANLNREKLKNLFSTASLNLEKSFASERRGLSRKWRAVLRDSYHAYREYLKSHPSSARSSIEIGVAEILLYADEDKVREPHLKRTDIASLVIDVEVAGSSLRTSASKSLALNQRAAASDKSLVKFLEIGFKGSYDQSGGHKTLARIGLHLPLGFTGAQVRSKKESALREYKIKSEHSQIQKRVGQIGRAFQFKKKLYLRLSSKLQSKGQVKRTALSTSLRAEDKIKIYIDAIKMSLKVMQLKYELAGLYNELLYLVSQSDSVNFIGLQGENSRGKGDLDG